jgi:Ni/Co efflux regulator RcnB
MNITRMLAAAGLVVASLGASTAAEAQDHRDSRGDRYEQRYDRDGRSDRDYSGDRDHRGYNGGDRYRHDNGHHRGNAYGHRRCRTEYRHHRRVTVCYR